MGGNILRGALALAILAVGCVADGADDPKPVNRGSEGQPIILGKVSTTHPEVGMLGVTNGRSLCTGTLVSPNVVLTAAHCLGGGTAYGFYTGAGKTTTATTINQKLLDGLPNTVKHPVKETGLYPKAVVRPEPQQASFDVAYAILEPPIWDITPGILGGTAKAKDVCTVVGYGWDNQSTPRGLLQKEATVKVASVGAMNFNVVPVSGAQHHGDSGGPMLCDGKQVGVFSYINDVTNYKAGQQDARIDIPDVAAFIAKLITDNAVENPDAGAPPVDDAGTPAAADSDAGVDASLPKSNAASPATASRPSIEMDGCSAGSRAPGSHSKDMLIAWAALGLAALARAKGRLRRSTRDV